MEFDIIYVCNSINNKNIRKGELEILRKYEDKLYFEFGTSETNIKKRFYNDLKTLNKDYDAILKLKLNITKEQKAFQEETTVSLDNNVDNVEKDVEIKNKPHIVKNIDKSVTHKIIKRKK